MLETRSMPRYTELFGALAVVLLAVPGACDGDGAGSDGPTPGSDAGGAADAVAADGTGDATGEGDSGPDAVDAGGDASEGLPGLPVLGDGDPSPSSVELETIGTADDGLNVPRDLAFDPEQPGQLWVVNRADHSVTVFTETGTAEQSASHHQGPNSQHFLAEPSGIAFGTGGRFATCHEEDEKTQPSTPENFMGPALWQSNLDDFDGGHGSHVDMLHNSPNAVGIAWDEGDAYWVADGMHASLTRYDFGEPHEPGGTDHSDGKVDRYVEGKIGYVPDVPSHLALDRDAELLYVSDTGNDRIAVLDTTTGSYDGPIFPNYDGTEQSKMGGAELRTLVDGAAVEGMEQPSGLALRDGVLYVSDHETSQLLAFDLDGELLDRLDLSGEVASGGLMGLAFDEEGRLHVVDAVDDRVLRVAPAGE